MLLVSLLVGCSIERMILVSDCSETEIEFNEWHSKAEDVEKIMDKYFSLGYPGLTVLIATPGEGIWMGSKGFSSLEAQKEMTNCNIIIQQVLQNLTMLLQR